MSNPQSSEHLDLERVLFFSDAVFAIAITLLVIEVRVPALPHDSTDRELGLALVGVFPKIVGFVISFFLIGQTWIEHHRIGLGFTSIPVVARVLDRTRSSPPIPSKEAARGSS